MTRRLAIESPWQPVATLLLAYALNIGAVAAEAPALGVRPPAMLLHLPTGQSLKIAGNAQRASLEAHNVPIDKLLRALARAFRFSLQYPIPRGTPISITLRDAPLDQILARTLRHHGFAFAPHGETSGEPCAQSSGKLWVWSGPQDITMIPSQFHRGAEPKANHGRTAANFFHPDASMRMDAIERLAQTPVATAVPYLAQALSDPNLYVRKTALEVAAGLRSASANLLLVDALHDADAKVRELAVDLLGEMPDARAEAALALARRDPAAAVRAAATEHSPRR